MSRHQDRVKAIRYPVVPPRGFCHAMMIDLKGGRPMENPVEKPAEVTAQRAPSRVESKGEGKRRHVPAEVTAAVLDYMRAAKNDLDGLTVKQIIGQLERVTGYDGLYRDFVMKWATVMKIDVRKERAASKPKPKKVQSRDELIQWLHRRVLALETALGMPTEALKEEAGDEQS